MTRHRVVSLAAGGLLALSTALIAVSGSALASGGVTPNVPLNTTGGTTGHQDFPIAWNDEGITHNDECGPFTPAAGQVVWHFILTTPSDSPNPAHLYPTFQTAGLLGPINEYARPNPIHWYVLTPTQDSLLGVWADNAGGQLNLSHICAGPNASPSIVVTATPFESVGGETSTPFITSTPFESVGGETGTPNTTTPPTSTDGDSGNTSTPLMALLICLAFGAMGLVVVEMQRRSANR